MLRLDLLGRIDLRDTDGNELRAVLAQPKRFALLVYLALGTPLGGIRRDTLLALFWPELDQERARKALNKAIHFLRQQLGDAAILSRGAGELAANSALLCCDVVEFIAACDRGDEAAAVELYKGELLPSFYVDETPDFERWLDERRTELRRMTARACHALAERRVREGEGAAALGFARRAAELSHDDERAVQRLLQLLGGLGDRAGALYAYDRFARRLASELDAEPAAETRELAERIRSKAVEPIREPITPVVPSEHHSPVGHSPTPVNGTAEAPTVRRATGPSFRRRRTMAALSMVVGATAGFLLWTRRHTGAPNELAMPTWILVADFESPPGDRTLGVAVRELVNSVMDESRVLKTVPGDQLAEARRAAMLPDTARLTPERARHLAMRSAVGIVVDGRVDRVGARYNVVLRATKVADGRVLTSAPDVATDANMLEVTKRLAGYLRADLVGREAARLEPVAGAVTPSLAAYRRFVEALPESLHYPQSAAMLREAVALDPDFAAAWARLGFALHQMGLRDESRAAYLTARRVARRLTRRERLILEANIARDVDLDSEAAVRWWDRIIAEEPALGIAYHERAFPLTDIARYDDAITSCQRAMALSPLGARAAETALCSGMMAAVGRTSEARELSSRLEGEHKWAADVTIASAESDWARLQALAETPPRGLVDTHYPPHALAASQASRGQVAEARKSLAGTKSVFGYPGGPVPLLELLLAVASGGTSDQYDSPRGFRDGVPTPAATDKNPAHWNQMLFPMWAAWRGDTARAEHEYRALKADTAASNKMDVEVSMVRAWIDSREGRWERVPGLLAADAWIGINGGAWWFGSLNLRRWLVAEAYEKMGRADSAAAFFRTLTRATRSSWPQAFSRGLVHSFALRRLALLEERLGQADSARAHWQQFLNTFTRPDPEFRPLVAEAQLKVSRMRTP